MTKLLEIFLVATLLFAMILYRAIFPHATFQHPHILQLNERSGHAFTAFLKEEAKEPKAQVNDEHPAGTRVVQPIMEFGYREHFSHWVKYRWGKRSQLWAKNDWWFQIILFNLKCKSKHFW